jgi:hypothetical protein
MVFVSESPWPDLPHLTGISQIKSLYYRNQPHVIIGAGGEIAIPLEFPAYTSDQLSKILTSYGNRHYPFEDAIHVISYSTIVFSSSLTGIGISRDKLKEFVTYLVNVMRHATM